MPKDYVASHAGLSLLCAVHCGGLDGDELDPWPRFFGLDFWPRSLAMRRGCQQPTSSRAQALVTIPRPLLQPMRLLSPATMRISKSGRRRSDAAGATTDMKTCHAQVSRYAAEVPDCRWVLVAHQRTWPEVSLRKRRR